MKKFVASSAVYHKVYLNKFISQVAHFSRLTSYPKRLNYTQLDGEEDEEHTNNKVVLMNFDRG